MVRNWIFLYSSFVTDIFCYSFGRSYLIAVNVISGLYIIPFTYNKDRKKYLNQVNQFDPSTLVSLQKTIKFKKYKIEKKIFNEHHRFHLKSELEDYFKVSYFF